MDNKLELSDGQIHLRNAAKQMQKQWHLLGDINDKRALDILIWLISEIYDKPEIDAPPEVGVFPHQPFDNEYRNNGVVGFQIALSPAAGFHKLEEEYASIFEKSV